uniref:Uncharacterized protein n=1 Tax=Arundo donax TaxID=35708 RepID=A0A0A9F988_ARUDO
MHNWIQKIRIWSCAKRGCNYICMIGGKLVDEHARRNKRWIVPM